MITQVINAEMSKVAALFDGCEETMVWSCLQGCMGSAWVNESWESARILNGDFCFFAGKPDEMLVRYSPCESSFSFVIMVPPDQAWGALIERVYGGRQKRVTRYAIKKEPDCFNRRRLEELAGSAGPEYEICMIGQELWQQARGMEWSRDLVSQFQNYEEYRKYGLGAAALHDGNLVSGASSYSYYRGGIEIEVDTRADYRRKGLAAACSARLILECLDRGLYPSWDAQNLWSVALAEKLGYHFGHEYPAYEVRGSRKV